jgi:hypothetical protein
MQDERSHSLLPVSSFHAFPNIADAIVSCTETL